MSFLCVVHNIKKVLYGDLLLGDLSTYLSGRYVSFKMQPFTFSEICILKQTTAYEDCFLDYLKCGGNAIKLYLIVKNN